MNKFLYKVKHKGIKKTILLFKCTMTFMHITLSINEDGHTQLLNSIDLKLLLRLVFPIKI